MRLLLPLLLVGCIDYSWGYGMKLDPGTDQEFLWAVQYAADEWNHTLSSCPNGPAVIVGHGGYPVKRVPKLDENYVGLFNGESIQVLEGIGTAEIPVLVHEIGHALGFGHVSEEHDPDSIMNPTIGPLDKISVKDVERAKRFFDCP